MMRAARAGAESYRRDAHLPRLLGRSVLPRHKEALLNLIGIEAELNTKRKDAEPDYSLLRHLDVLIAMVGEARILRAAQTAALT